MYGRAYPVYICVLLLASAGLSWPMTLCYYYYYYDHHYCYYYYHHYCDTPFRLQWLLPYVNICMDGFLHTRVQDRCEDSDAARHTPPLALGFGFGRDLSWIGAASAGASSTKILSCTVTACSKLVCGGERGCRCSHAATRANIAARWQVFVLPPTPTPRSMTKSSSSNGRLIMRACASGHPISEQKSLNAWPHKSESKSLSHSSSQVQINLGSFQEWMFMNSALNSMALDISCSVELSVEAAITYTGSPASASQSFRIKGLSLAEGEVAGSGCAAASLAGPLGT